MRPDELFREPLDDAGRLFVYDWNWHSLFGMQWCYLLEWPPGRDYPEIYITRYTCWQRKTEEDPFEEVDLPLDMPMSDSILKLLADHAGKELYRRSRVVGFLKAVPQNFLERAREAGEKGYSLKLLREMCQKESAPVPPLRGTGTD